MSKISLQPNASGAGTFSIVAPDSNTNRTLTLPDESGAVIAADASTGQFASSNMPAGSVIQVLQTVKTSSYFVNLSTFTTDTQNVPGLDTSISPISQNSKILISFDSGDGRDASALDFGTLLFRDGSLVTDAVGTGTSGAAAEGLTSGGGMAGTGLSFSYIDSPNTIATVTYGIRLKSVRDADRPASIGLVSTGGSVSQEATKLSTLTLMEIAG